VFTCLFLSNIYVPSGNRGSRRGATESSPDDGPSVVDPSALQILLNRDRPS
jgi:hypothetical protein